MAGPLDLQTMARLKVSSLAQGQLFGRVPLHRFQLLFQPECLLVIRVKLENGTEFSLALVSVSAGPGNLGFSQTNIDLGKMDADAIWRCLGALDLKALREFMTAVADMTRAAKEMTITTPAGANVSFTNAGRPVTNECGDASTPGAHFMLGQIGWAPIEESIEGEIVFDGSFSGGGHMDLGILRNPIKFVIKKGRIVDIVGQEEAKIVKEWLANLNDERMYYLAHTCYGFNPGARLSGGCTEDERIWGCTQWGFGYQGAFFEGALGDAVTHGDGICLNSSVWLDGKQFLDAGKVIEPKLGQLAKKLGK